LYFSDSELAETLCGIVDEVKINTVKINTGVEATVIVARDTRYISLCEHVAV